MFTGIICCLGDSMKSVVISVRIRKEEKKLLEEEGVNVEAAVKEYLVNRASMSRQRKMIDRLTKVIKKRVRRAPAGTAEKLIREDRDAGH